MWGPRWKRTRHKSRALTAIHPSIDSPQTAFLSSHLRTTTHRACVRTVGVGVALACHRGRARRQRARRRRRRIPRRSRWRGSRRRRDAGSWMRSCCWEFGITRATLTTPGAPWYVRRVCCSRQVRLCMLRQRTGKSAHCLLQYRVRIPTGFMVSPYVVALSSLPPPTLALGAEGPGGGGAMVSYGNGAVLRGGALRPGPDLSGHASAGVRCAAGK